MPNGYPAVQYRRNSYGEVSPRGYPGVRTSNPRTISPWHRNAANLNARSVGRTYAARQTLQSAMKASGLRFGLSYAGLIYWWWKEINDARELYALSGQKSPGWNYNGWTLQTYCNDLRVTQAAFAFTGCGYHAATLSSWNSAIGAGEFLLGNVWHTSFFGNLEYYYGVYRAIKGSYWSQPDYGYQPDPPFWEEAKPGIVGKPNAPAIPPAFDPSAQPIVGPMPTVLPIPYPYIPYRKPVPWLVEQTERGNAPRGRPPQPGNPWTSLWRLSVDPSLGLRLRVSPRYRLKRPPRNVRERKLHLGDFNRSALGVALNAATEAVDIIDAFHDALPEVDQFKGTYRETWKAHEQLDVVASDQLRRDIASYERHLYNKAKIAKQAARRAARNAARNGLSKAAQDAAYEREMDNAYYDPYEVAADYRAIEDRNGLVRVQAPHQKLAALWKNWHHVDLQQAMKNLITNEVQDQIIGRTNRTLGKTQRNNFRDGYGAGRSLTIGPAL